LRIKSHFPKSKKNFIQTKSINMSTMDKVKNALHLNKEHDPASTTHHHNAATQNTSTSAGPHSSNLANKVDPTVDSDRRSRL
jgi:hypothetical protein